MKHFYLLFLLAISFSSIHAQGFSLQWQKCLGGSGNEKANGIIQTANSGFLITGESFSNDGDVSGHHGTLTTSDAWVVNTNAVGNITWQKSMGGSGYDDFQTAIKTNDGNYLLIGSTSSTDGDVTGNHGQFDIWVVKITPSGTMLWQKCYGGTKNETATAALKLADGTVVIAGDANSSDGNLTGNTGVLGRKDVWLVKIDPLNGNLLAQKNYGSSQDDVVSGITLDGTVLTISVQPGFYDNDWGTTSAGPTPNALLFFTDFSLNRVTGQQSYSRTYSLLPRRHSITGNRINAFNFDRCYPNTHIESLSIIGQGLVYDYHYTCPAPPNLTPFTTYTNGGTRSFQLNEDNIPQICGRSNDTSTQFNLRGGWDAFISEKPQNNTLVLTKGFGGSADEVFTEFVRPNPNTFIITGYTNSNNGDVSGNHGGNDIWLVSVDKYQNNIRGYVFFDINSNTIKDNNEPYYYNALVKTQKPGSSATSFTSTGFFNNITDTGNYTTTTTIPAGYYVPVPATRNTTFNQYGNTDSFNVAVTPIPGIKDLQIKLIPTTPVRPGFECIYELIYGNKGTAVVNNTQLQFYKHNQLSFISASRPGAVVTGDTITWQTGNLNPLQYDTILLTLKNIPPPLLVIGQNISASATIFPVTGDQYQPDNHASIKQLVVGAFDPNDKTEHHGGTITEAAAMAGAPLQYTIRFQNTGNDTAFNVVITDTLDNRLDAASFRHTGSSHPCTISIKDDKYITYSFRNILLPDSNRNELRSHGFLSFEINIRAAAIVLNDSVRNSSSIYFDFNAPVKTNTVSTKIIRDIPPVPAITGMGALYCNLAGVQRGKLQNPSSNYTINIKLDNQPLTYNAADSSFSFDVTNLAAGAHTIKVIYSNASGSDSASRIFNVDRFVQVVITNADQTVCALSAPINLLANTTAIWNGNGVVGTIFNPAVAGVGLHKIIATKTNGACPDSKDTVTITVNALVLPDVNITASQNILSSATAYSDLSVISIAGGGTNPLYSFATDRNFNQLLRAESASNSFRVLPQMLAFGANRVYVRMKSNFNCVTTNTALDSIQITLSISTPGKEELEKALKIFPNPNDGKFGFRIETGVNDRVSIRLLDMNGKQVFAQDYGLVQQYNFSKPVNVSQLQKGIYIMVVQVGEILITRRIAIAR
jgi:uncharacterized repeat protein (TIGR01451 family)